jgi:hypothetical protein
MSLTATGRLGLKALGRAGGPLEDWPKFRTRFPTVPVARAEEGSQQLEPAAQI